MLHGLENMKQRLKENAKMSMIFQMSSINFLTIISFKSSNINLLVLIGKLSSKEITESFS